MAALPYLLLTLQSEPPDPVDNAAAGAAAQVPGGASPQPAHQFRRRDDDEFGRRASQAHGENLIGFVRDILGRETPRTAVVVHRGVLEAGVAEPAMAPGLVGLTRWCRDRHARQRVDADVQRHRLMGRRVEDLLIERRPNAQASRSPSSSAQKDRLLTVRFS